MALTTFSYFFNYNNFLITFKRSKNILSLFVSHSFQQLCFIFKIWTKNIHSIKRKLASICHHYQICLYNSMNSENFLNFNWISLYISIFDFVKTTSYAERLLFSGIYVYITQMNIGQRRKRNHQRSNNLLVDMTN